MNALRGLEDRLGDPRLQIAMGRMMNHLPSAMENAGRLLERTAADARAGVGIGVGTGSR